MVRTFYTYRLTPKGGINIWYADVEFGFYEALPKRVADLNATHVVIEVMRPSPSHSFCGYLTVLFLLSFQGSLVSIPQ